MSRLKGQTCTRTVTVGLRARAWWYVRKNKRCTLPDLLRTLADGKQKDPAANIRKYFTRLVAVGVLAVDEERVPDGKATSNGLYGYRLARDLGPKAPVVRKFGGVYDPNAQVLLVEPEEASP